MTATYADQVLSGLSGPVVLTAEGDGAWLVTCDGNAVGTWHRTGEGAVLDDTAGERVAIVTAFAGTQVAAVAGCGRYAQAWADLAHKVLAGNCEISG